MNRWAFHIRASYNDETELIVRQLTSLNVQKIAVFYQNDAYGKAGLDGVELALKTRNMKTVGQAPVERNSVAVGPAVKALVAAQPDAIVQIGSYKACAAFIRQARAAGFGGTFFNVSFVGTQALADELGKDATGVVVSQVMPSPYNAARPVTREFLAAVKKAGGEHQANFSSMEGYLAAKVLAEGLRRGKPTHEGLVAGLESMGNEDFGGFNVTFSPNDHVASKFVELSMLTGDGKVRT
jgi:ABC-type branched-subunit amino acid transport system substrate-binding protein